MNPFDLQWQFLIGRAHREGDHKLRDNLIEAYNLNRIDRDLDLYDPHVSGFLDLRKSLTPVH